MIQHFFYDTLDSTNTQMRRLLKDHKIPLSEGSLVRAASQTAGKGRLGRLWESPRGNVYVTLLLNPAETNRNHLAQLSLVAGVAVVRALTTLLFSSQFDQQKEGRAEFCLRPRLKWPNDVYIGKKKIAGILVETEPSLGNQEIRCLVGVGVNVLCAPSEATALKDQGVSLSPWEVLRQILQEWSILYPLWNSQGFSPIRPLWEEFGPPYGTPLVISRPNREATIDQISGTFLEIDPHGALHFLSEEGDIHRISSGEVTFV